jgi:hypothetical protein
MQPILLATWLAAAAAGASSFSAPPAHLTSQGVRQRAHVTCQGRYPVTKPGEDPGVVLCPVDPPHPAGSLPIVRGGHVRFTVRGGSYVRLTLIAPDRRDPRFGHSVLRLRPRPVAGSRDTWQARVPLTLKVVPTGLSASADLPHRGYADYVLGVRVRPVP